jgi:cytochrome c556
MFNPEKNFENKTELKQKEEKYRKEVKRLDKKIREEKETIKNKIAVMEQRDAIEEKLREIKEERNKEE